MAASHGFEPWQSDPTLRLWDLENGQTLRTLQGHTGKITHLAVTPDGISAISASDPNLGRDPTLRLWDLERGQTLQALEGHPSSVCAVAVTPDGRRAVCASDDRTLRVWDLESGQTLHTLEGHADLLNAALSACLTISTRMSTAWCARLPMPGRWTSAPWRP